MSKRDPVENTTVYFCEGSKNRTVMADTIGAKQPIEIWWTNAPVDMRRSLGHLTIVAQVPM
jgi:hypothetical protein